MKEIKHTDEGGFYQNKFWSTYPIEIISENDNNEYTCHIACSEKIDNAAMSDITAKQIQNL